MRWVIERAEFSIPLKRIFWDDRSEMPIAHHLRRNGAGAEVAGYSISASYEYVADRRPPQAVARSDVELAAKADGSGQPIRPPA